MLITYNLEMLQAIKVEHKVIASSGGSNTPIWSSISNFMCAVAEPTLHLVTIRFSKIKLKKEKER